MIWCRELLHRRHSTQQG